MVCNPVEHSKIYKILLSDALDLWISNGLLAHNVFDLGQGFL